MTGGGSFVRTGRRYFYAIEAWTDQFATWRHGFELKRKAGADLTSTDRGRRMLTKAQVGENAALRDPATMRGFSSDRRGRPLLTAELRDPWPKASCAPT